MYAIRDEDIAIVGMALRFPGAATLTTFWQNLCDGRETIHRFDEAELKAAGIDPSISQQPNYVKAKGIVDRVEYFDPAFFGMSSLEAKILDPQHRLFLMCAWEALENAGYAPSQHKNRVGVFASTGMSLYLLKNLLSNQAFLKNADEYQLLLGNDKDFLATRVSYLLNLQGPSVNLQTGCSSSLVSVHYACQSLLNGECDLALAGGVSITIPQMQGYLYKKEMIGSPDGHCYAFDTRAQGTVKSNGVGVVTLKLLSDAVRDQDHVYAVIRGTAINNDGANKVGYTAPSVAQQAAVIREALQMADVAPAWVEYIETHGTGTLLGDPIEIAALKQAFSMHQDHATCALASLKTNLGHLDVAAGVAGLIKACLAVYHGKIPASLNFSTLNPKMTLDNTPFYVNTTLKEWQSRQPYRYAGVSAFGIGGTNVHVVLKQAPVQKKSSIDSTKTNLMPFSARSKKSLAANVKALAAYLEAHPNTNLTDIAFTLQHGREVMPYRCAFAVNHVADLKEQAETVDVESLSPIKNPKPVAFLFSGQGSQYPGMGTALYASDSHFRDALDTCVTALQKHMVHDLKSLLFADGRVEAHEQLKQTEIAQPALFAIEYALAKTYLAYGVKPAALIGHSIGEYTAAVLAGIFTLEDAARLIALRGRLVQRLPHGSMLAVYADAEKITAILPDQLDIALINAPGMTVVSGVTTAIDAFSTLLQSMNIRFQFLHTSHAFHSRMLDGMLEEFAAVVAQTRRSQPLLPIASNVTGDWLSQEEACSVEYWVRQLRQTVKFSQGVMTVEKQFAPLFIEVGPGRALQSLVLRHGIKQVYNSLPQAGESEVNQSIFMNTLAQLWSLGAVVNPDTHGNRIPLPVYQWDLERCWIEPDAAPYQERSDNIIELPKRNDDIKIILTHAWKSVLGLDLISDEDHFFNLGGNSIAAIQLIDRLPKTLHEQISVVHLYQYPKFIDFMRHVQTLSQQSITTLQNTDENNAEQQLFSSQEEL